MNPRFILMTFAACIVMFGAIFAVSAPRKAAPAVVAAPVVLYADCDAARAAHAAPMRAGMPGYRPALDGNMNGIACESVGGTDNIAAPVPANADSAVPMSIDGTAPASPAPPPSDAAPTPTFAAGDQIPTGLTGLSTDQPPTTVQKEM